MNDFAWTSPTQFVFGRDAEEKIGPWAASAGARRALLVFGQGHGGAGQDKGRRHCRI